MAVKPLIHPVTIEPEVAQPVTTTQSRRAQSLPLPPAALLGAGIVLLVLLLSLLGPLLSPYDPIAMAPAQRLLGPGSAGHPLGTDMVGRDLLTRLLIGGRQTLLIGIMPVLLSLVIGSLLGLIAGFHGGWTDNIIMRCLDVLFAFPAILLAIAIVAALGPGINNAILAITVVAIPTVARIVRAPVLSLREQEFVQAARVIGADDSRIILRHIGLNLISPLIVFASVEMGAMIIFGAGLSFLGLGAQPPQPEWGLMLAEGRDVLAVAPHVATLPGLAIVMVVLGLNFLGDGLRDRLDPRSSLQGVNQMSNRLSVAVDIEMDGLDPHNLIGGAARRVAPNISPGLLRLKRDWTIGPALAESWETSVDGRQVTLRLRPAVRFHSGRELTAEAVVKNFARICGADSPSYQRFDYQVVERVEGLDRLTVRFTLSEPFAPFLGLLANNTGITDVAALDSRDPRTRPIGAGPYELVDWVAGERLELRAFAAYFQSGLPKTPEVEWRFVAEASDRTDQLLAGSTQLICVPELDRLGQLRAAGLTVDVAAGHGPSHLTFNCAEPPFSDPRVRLAVAQAVDRSSLLQRLFGGLGTASCTPFAPGSPWYVELTAPAYDPDRARWLMHQAGLGGQRLRLTLPVNGPGGARMGAAIGEYLAEIDIDLDVQPYPNPIWWPGIYTSGNWNLIFQTWTPMPDPDQTLWRRYHSKGIFNIGHYASAAMDQHLAAGRHQLDPAQRRAAYAAAQQLIIDDLPSMYLFHEPIVEAWSPRLRGYKSHPIWAFELAQSELS